MKGYALGVLCALLVSGAALAKDKLSKADLAAINATPEDVSQLLIVTDDPFKPSIVISSQPFFGGKNSSDQYMRAFINRKTRAVTYQLYVTRTYGGSDWRFYGGIDAIGENGAEPLKAERIGSDVNCSRYGCSYYEVVAAEVPIAMMKWIASGARPGVDERWRWKLSSRFTNTFEGDEAGLLKTEVAGVLLAAERIAAEPVGVGK